jgi:starch phosphorylase
VLADPTTPRSRAELADDARTHARHAFAHSLEELAGSELWRALALSVRDRLVDRMVATSDRYARARAKRVAYFSMEFLIGRSLRNNLLNLGLLDEARDLFAGLRLRLDDVLDQEPDAALGNGGLGRLAACFLDSLATLDMPGYGYGINYEYGLFRQEIDNGAQREKPDNWLTYGTPWQIHRPSEAVQVPVYGRIEHARDRAGNYNPTWLDWKVLVGIPHDMPVVGYGGRTVNYLRLFAARSANELDMEFFNTGDYVKAVEREILSETVTKVLYPSDTIAAGRELRLIQEYFLVACGLRDIIRRYLRGYTGFEQFPDVVAVQLNDTHPTLAVPELMRYLIDEADLPWEKAWDVVQRTFGFTNHTLMPEALEKWPVPLLERVLPRHLQIIYEINRRFLEEAGRAFPNDGERLRRLSLVEEGEPKQVRMAHLAIVGSHSVNGVARLHSELVKTSLVPDFFALWPKKFNNKTNGVTQRRWLLGANPALADLLTRTVGPGWVTDLSLLRGLEPVAADATFRDEFLRSKRSNQERLARLARDVLRLTVDPAALFDVQIKRIHEYKRQLLNVLHIIHRYLELTEDGKEPAAPRVWVFAGKAAPGYWAAKQIIRLIHGVARVVNADPKVRGLMKVVFLPDYRVSLAEVIIPAADLSEQISTAGTEASGTSNMKFAMNGALTVGTLDGANIEIREAVGPENFFVFGLTAEQIQDLKRRGAYNPFEYARGRPLVRRVLDALKADRFSADHPGLFAWVVRALTEDGDRYFHLADLEPYIDVQQQADRVYTDRPEWARRAVLNVARVGDFSSDRTIREYARDIWDLKPVPPDGAITPSDNGQSG